MTDKISKDNDVTQDSLVDALESIKLLLAKSDSKLAAARESIAIASNQTAMGKLGMHEQHELEIPVLDDIVMPSDFESVTEEVSNISEQLSEKIDETLAAVNESIPALSVSEPDPQIVLDYLDTLQIKLEKTLRDSLMKSIVTIEAGLKKSLIAEIDKIRDQVTKDLS
jgi:bifunctional pyridoxal-dependent enzyme with beta-cystathionase and maltose regulon repressor activities